MQSFTQVGRLISISDFGLGEDTFLLTGFKGSEYISDLFQFEISVLSGKSNILPQDVVGKTATITIHSDNPRTFHGHISHFTFGEVKGAGLREYKMIMVPWLWFLSKNNNHRVFQEKSTKDIVTKIFDDLGFNDVDFQAEGGMPREYCVQHNESDLHFVSRLLEEEGIAYYFIHDNDKHTLILVDEFNGYQECVETNIECTSGNKPGQQIYNWERRYGMSVGQWTLNDYDPSRPEQDLIVTTSSLNTRYANSSPLEHYEYPGLYQSHAGESLIRIRMEAAESESNVISAESNCPTFYAGGKFKLAKHHYDSEKGSYLITGITHSACETSYLPEVENRHNSSSDNVTDNKVSVTNSQIKHPYKNELVCVPADIPFRPQQRHLRPVMRGDQSAVVVGPPGEEIYTDDNGRIKVQFIWDRNGDKNENSSCFLRVMQMWAGNKWGASFIPRIGNEVIVSFLDGDPDRPIVSGSVYNGKNKPPYQSKTESGIKSRSSKGATASNFNEFRFDDKLGAEKVVIQAEKDLQLQIKNDESRSVGNNCSKNVASNDSLSVGGGHSRSIGGDESVSVGADRTDNVSKNVSNTVGKNFRENIGENSDSTISLNANTNIGGNQTENIAGKKSLNVASKSTEMVGSVKMTTVGAGYMLNVGAVLNEIVGGARLSEVGAYSLEAVGGSKTIKVGGDLTISVAGKITISSGEASIVMEDGSVSINGKVIDLN